MYFKNDCSDFMTINGEMYKEFSNVVIGEDSISNDALLQVLKDYAGTVSVFDLMKINAELIEESKYVQDSYKEKAHGVYAKYFLARLKEVRSNNNHYTHKIDKDEFILGKSIQKADYAFDKKSVSRAHLAIIRKDGNYFAKDLSSLNGSFVNGEKINPQEEVAIKNEDVIKLADVELKFYID